MKILSEKTVDIVAYPTDRLEILFGGRVILSEEIGARMHFDYIAALALDETDLTAIGLPRLEEALVGLFGTRRHE